MKLCITQGIETFHSSVLCAEVSQAQQKRAASTALNFPSIEQRSKIVQSIEHHESLVDSILQNSSSIAHGAKNNKTFGVVQLNLFYLD